MPPFEAASSESLIVSHRSPVRITDKHQFHTLIDARSPAEFALDHIPGAINCPVLDDEERATIGTIYKQVSPFEAKRLGAAMVSANLARHLRETFADKPADWKPLIYCWRGGLRSGSMVTWLRLVGWDAQQLAGGYKYFRHHVMAQLEQLVPQLQLRVLCGATGSAKTRVLHALAAQWNLVYAPDPKPEAGHFFRSDHFPFAKRGVPAISYGSGNDWVEGGGNGVE